MHSVLLRNAEYNLVPTPALKLSEVNAFAVRDAGFESLLGIVAWEYEARQIRPESCVRRNRVEPSMS